MIVHSSSEPKSDIAVLRELARQYAEAASRPVQDERRAMWRGHNSFERTGVPVYIRGGVCWRELLEPSLACEDPFYRNYEFAMRTDLLRDSLDDDTVLEPWITVRAEHILPGGSIWGLEHRHIPPAEPGGAWRNDPPIETEADIEKLTVPEHRIDEEATRRRVGRMQDAIGDLVTINVSRAPAWLMWTGDICTELGHLRGIEQAMYDMMDRPEWLHRLLAFMRDGILKAHAEAEAAGDWRLADHQNQAMPYSRELRDPQANSESVTRKDLWGYCAAQELTLVSPAMHEEFMLQYQRPILEKFGLSAYGCCEDLTHKIDMVRSIANLRRIAVTPRADVRKSAEQIGEDYVISWRPNPAETVCCGFDESRVRTLIREGLAACRGLHVDISMKDIQTVEGDVDRFRQFIRVVREETEGW